MLEYQCGELIRREVYGYLRELLAEHPLFTPPTSKFHRMVATCCEPKGQVVARAEAKGQGVPRSRAIHVGFHLCWCSRHQCDAMHHALK